MTATLTKFEEAAADLFASDDVTADGRQFVRRIAATKMNEDLKVSLLNNLHMSKPEYDQLEQCLQFLELYPEIAAVAKTTRGHIFYVPVHPLSKDTDSYWAIRLCCGRHDRYYTCIRKVSYEDTDLAMDALRSSPSGQQLFEEISNSK
jgi:hypothetical protein